jgi:hypothetical protein
MQPIHALTNCCSAEKSRVVKHFTHTLFETECLCLVCRHIVTAILRSRDRTVTTFDATFELCHNNNGFWTSPSTLLQQVAVSIGVGNFFKPTSTFSQLTNGGSMLPYQQELGSPAKPNRPYACFFHGLRCLNSLRSYSPLLMSIELEPKAPTRLDSQETRVEIREEYVTAAILDEPTPSPTDSRLPRFSFNQASRPDTTYNLVCVLDELMTKVYVAF